VTILDQTFNVKFLIYPISKTDAVRTINDSISEIICKAL